MFLSTVHLIIIMIRLVHYNRSGCYPSAPHLSKRLGRGNVKVAAWGYGILTFRKRIQHQTGSSLPTACTADAGLKFASVRARR
jgi:hypothetical protein